MMTDSGAQSPHPFHDGRKINFDAVGDLDAELMRLPDLGQRPGGADDGLGGHTAVIQTVTAEQVPLHQGHFGPQTGGAGGSHQTGRTGADDHQIVSWGRFRILPVRGMDVGHQGLIRFVQGVDRGRGK